MGEVALQLVRTHKLLSKDDPQLLTEGALEDACRQKHQECSRVLDPVLHPVLCEIPCPLVVPARERCVSRYRTKRCKLRAYQQEKPICRSSR